MSVVEEAFPGVWPMSGVVASALMNTPVLRDAVNVLGVREAGTASIMKMFEDGFQVKIGSRSTSTVKGEAVCSRMTLCDSRLISHSMLHRYIDRLYLFALCGACEFHGGYAQ